MEADSAVDKIINMNHGGVPWHPGPVIMGGSHILISYLTLDHLWYLVPWDPPDPQDFFFKFFIVIGWHLEDWDPSDAESEMLEW